MLQMYMTSSPFDILKKHQMKKMYKHQMRQLSHEKDCNRKTSLFSLSLFSLSFLLCSLPVVVVVSDRRFVSRVKEDGTRTRGRSFAPLFVRAPIAREGQNALSKHSLILLIQMVQRLIA